MEHITPTAPAAVTPDLELGVIDPATAADLLDLIEVRHGRSDFVYVTLDGRVCVYNKFCPMDPDEQRALLDDVADHVYASDAGARALEDAVRVNVEPAGSFYRAVLAFPGGGRQVIAGSLCTPADAAEWGRSRLRRMLPALVIAQRAAGVSVAA